jgi:hypothetical protein
MKLIIRNMTSGTYFYEFPKGQGTETRSNKSVKRYKLAGSVIKRGVGSVLKGYNRILKGGKSGKNVIKRVHAL